VLGVLNPKQNGVARSPSGQAQGFWQPLFESSPMLPSAISLGLLLVSKADERSAKGSPGDVALALMSVTAQPVECHGDPRFVCLGLAEYRVDGHEMPNLHNSGGVRIFTKTLNPCDPPKPDEDLGYALRPLVL
jgi:hypothetical protein